MGHCFHANCGANVDVFDEGRTLIKTDKRRKTNSVALTLEPLMAGETFEITYLESSPYTEDGGLEIGLTSNHPDSLLLPRTMTDCEEKVTYMISAKYVVRNRHAVDKMNVNTKQIQVGDVLGVRLGNLGNVQFLLNHRCIGTAYPQEHVDAWYGVVDLYGKPTKVSINNTLDFREPRERVPEFGVPREGAIGFSLAPKERAIEPPSTPIEGATDFSLALKERATEPPSGPKEKVMEPVSVPKVTAVPKRATIEAGSTPKESETKPPGPKEKVMEPVSAPKVTAIPKRTTSDSPSMPKESETKPPAPKESETEPPAPKEKVIESYYAAAERVFASPVDVRERTAGSVYLPEETATPKKTPTPKEIATPKETATPKKTAAPTEKAMKSPSVPKEKTTESAHKRTTPKERAIASPSAHKERPAERLETVPESRSTDIGSVNAVECVGIMLDVMETKETGDMNVVQTMVGNIKLVLDKRREKRPDVAEELMKRNGAEIVTEYIRFLKSQVHSHNKALDVYADVQKVLYMTCDQSKELSRTLGGTGLLDLMVDDLKQLDVGDHRQQRIIANAILTIHAAAKVPENISLLQQLRFVDAAMPCTDSARFKEDFVIAAVMAMSYVMVENEASMVQLSKETCATVLRWLKDAISDKDNHMRHGWRADEICVGLANLAANFENIRHVVEKGGHIYFARLIVKAKNDHEKECGLRALQAYTVPRSSHNIAKVPRMLDVVREAGEKGGDQCKVLARDILRQLEGCSPATHGFETADKETSDVFASGSMPAAAAAAAYDTSLANIYKKSSKRIVGTENLRKGLGSVRKMDRNCAYKELCKQFFKSLKLQSAYFMPANDRCFCEDCHKGRKVAEYQPRGQPPVQYTLPIGWCRFGLELPPKVNAIGVNEKWHKAFHGSKHRHLATILQIGELAVPGVALLGGEHLFERSVHLGGRLCLEAGSGKKIFMSPSIHYAGGNAYATPERFVSRDGTEYFARVAFEVFVSPDSYVSGRQTIGLTAPIDPKISNDKIEWTTDAMGSTVLYGLLVKLEKPPT